MWKPALWWTVAAWAEQRSGLDLSPGLLAWAGAGYVVKVVVVYGAYRYWKARRARRAGPGRSGGSRILARFRGDSIKQRRTLAAETADAARRQK
ncbi:MAG: hypothetical protein M1602_01085 [Firmicutes bacterium]|nr:hypothetical protein [Bacillota bacterium]